MDDYRPIFRDHGIAITVSVSRPVGERRRHAAVADRLEAGFYLHLTKPAGPDHLEGLLADVSRQLCK